MYPSCSIQVYPVIINPPLITVFFEDNNKVHYYHYDKSARQSMFPERIEPSVLDVEVDLCLMECDVDFSVRRAPD